VVLLSSEIVFKEEKLQDIYKLSISGEVDVYTAQSLKDKVYSIIEMNKMDLLIECSGLNYIDSTGLGIFVGALKKVKENGDKIYISHLKENIRKLFIITGLDKLFIIKE
jgi:anti-sigma B factor antagonist